MKKEKCDHYLKNVNIGHKIYVCSKCDCIIHSTCYKASKATTIENEYFCCTCKLGVIKRYNPFKLVISGEDENDIDVDTLRMSTILDQCKSHTTSEINKSLEDNLVNNSSIYFLNIDGNKSYFNNLSVEIRRNNTFFTTIFFYSLSRN